MDRHITRTAISVFLIALGVFILLNNLNLLPFDLSNVFLVGMFALGGLAFLAAYLGGRHDNWWALIPSFTLLGLAILVGLPAAWSELGGGLFLGMIGLSFWVIYLTRREFWWAVIPGGVLITLAGVAAFSNQVEGMAGGLFVGGIFFLGLALTFLLVYLLPTAEGRNRWAIWPAGILGLMGALLSIGMGDAARYVWPLALIVFGGLLVFRALGPKAQ